MTEFTVSVEKSINAECASNNVFYYKSLPIITKSPCYLLAKEKSHVRTAIQMSTIGMKDNHIYLNTQDRIEFNLGLGDKLELFVVPCPSTIKTLFISVTDKSKVVTVNNVNNLMREYIKNKLINTVVNANTYFAFVYPHLYYAQTMTLLDNDKNEISYGLVDDSTELIVIDTSKKTFQFNMSSVDFEKIGVGGLEKEFTELIKNIFLTRIIPEKVYKKLGIKHIKGAILHGPPGCGKTRTAKQLGSLIGCKNIKIVNGPELLNKFVGESEKNIRECFELAKKNPEELHLLIFDEFDALASQRYGTDTSQTNDRIVGQLLTMMDGIEEINNIIVFALTNRLDMIDPAMLRPGRFGVHIHIRITRSAWPI